MDVAVREFVVNASSNGLTEDQVFEKVIERFGLPVREHSQTEIAERQRVSVSMIKKVEARAIRKLRDLLVDDF